MRRTSTSPSFTPKGPVGLLPFLVVIGYFAVERRLGSWRDWFPVWGLALSLGPACLWLATTLTLAPPGFFEAAVMENLFDRFARGASHPRPFYYYAFQFPADFMPWTLLWPLAAVALAKSWRQEPRAEARGWHLAATWLGVFFLFFSLSAEKRGLYLLPAFPAAALLCGAALERALAGRERLPAGLQAVLEADVDRYTKLEDESGLSKDDIVRHVWIDTLKKLKDAKFFLSFNKVPFLMEAAGLSQQDVANALAGK